MKLNDLIHRVRAHPGLPSNISALGDDDFAFAVAQMVAPAIQQLSGNAGMVVGERHYTFSDPAAATATLDSAGVANLTTLIANQGLLLERLNFGEITHPDSAFPLVLQSHSGEGVLPGNYDTLFLHCWLVGPKLHTRSADNNVTPLTGSLAFASPRVSGLDGLNSQLDDELLTLVVLRLRGAPTSPKAVADAV